MHEGLSCLKYGPPYLAKALFTLAMQAQAHKCRIKNLFLYIVVETSACACVVIVPRKQKAA